MRHHRLRCCLLVVPFYCTFFLAGCGTEAAVKGTVVFPPGLTLQQTDVAEIRFQPAERGPKSSAARIQTDGTFVATKVPSGSDKIVITVVPAPSSTPEGKNRETAFAALNKNFNAANSPLTYDVTGEPEQKINVDLALKKVTKK
jgi:hypothetical protein